MPAYYNEFDPYAAQWLRNLIAAGLIAPGDVDERSITEVSANDLAGYTQCHFFAGIGGWSYALRLAGWPDDKPVWTGSCPCQPFSSAGQRKGHADERHLWPSFFHLISERRPPVVFGEQVASGDGPEWIAGVRADLEAIGFEVGIAVLPAACVSAPHQRHRINWVSNPLRRRDEAAARGGDCSQSTPFSSPRREASRASASAKQSGSSLGMGVANSDGRTARSQTTKTPRFWDTAVATSCRDGKWRRIEPGISPLVNGLPEGVDYARAFGNAIVPQATAEFIKAYAQVRAA